MAHINVSHASIGRPTLFFNIGRRLGLKSFNRFLLILLSMYSFLRCDSLKIEPQSKDYSPVRGSQSGVSKNNTKT